MHLAKLKGVLSFLFFTNPRPLADPGGAAARAPQQDQFLSFSHTFSPKSVRIGGWRPPPQRVGAPPTGNPGSATADD